jgi:hypothetical protein
MKSAKTRRADGIQANMMRMASCLYILCFLVILSASNSIWTLEDVVELPDDLRDHVGAAYGSSPSLFYGQGIQTLISGYDSNNSGIFIHTSTGLKSAGMIFITG